MLIKFGSVKICQCKFNSPHEKGSVERSNRDFRRIFPKGTDFSKIETSQVKEAEFKINNIHMKLLRLKIPAQVEQEELVGEEIQYQKSVIRNLTL